MNLPLRLNNLYAKSTTFAKSPKLAATVSEPDHNYIIRGVLAGEHGAMQAILSHFWLKFTKEVREGLQLKPFWKPEHPEKIAELLERLNFESVDGLKRQNENLNNLVDSLNHELSSLRSNGQRRANTRTPNPTPKPPPSNSKRKRIRGSNPKSPVVPRKSKGNEVGSNGDAEDKAQEEIRQQEPSIT